MQQALIDKLARDYKDVKELDVSNNAITEISSLCQLTWLESLCLSGNQVSHIHGLGTQLTNLRELDLSSNTM